MLDNLLLLTLLQYWFDVSSILSSCNEADRVLSINFGSAPKIADEIVSLARSLG